MRDEHYENFPVASILMPRRLRRPVGLIYNFARRADDFADEGDLPPENRLALLNGFRGELQRIKAGTPCEAPLFRDIADMIAEHRLPLQPFFDLLDAFSQDVVKRRYANIAEVMDYCRRSANPVGTLLLHLYGAATDRNLAYSNAICSALQLINFWQDVAVDWKKDRVYFPLDDMNKYGISEAQIARGDTGGLWRPFMLFQVERARHLLQSGAPLGRILPGRLGLEMRMIIMGGEAILRKIHKDPDVFNNRPVLKPGDWIYMFWRAIRKK